MNLGKILVDFFFQEEIVRRVHSEIKDAIGQTIIVKRE